MRVLRIRNDRRITKAQGCSWSSVVDTVQNQSAHRSNRLQKDALLTSEFKALILRSSPARAHVLPFRVRSLAVFASLGLQTALKFVPQAVL